jgi:hypothetical protein
MNKSKNAFRVIAVVALAAALAACGGGGGAATDELALAQSADAAESPLRAKAATCGYAHIYITVERVQALQQTATGEQWIDVALTAPKQLDLATLTGGVLQALGAAPLAAGQYSQLRLVLSSNSGSGLANAVQPTGGNLATLGVPSGTQSGLKLVGDFNVPAGGSADVVLQGFDPCAAVLQTGSRASPKYQLKPTLAATVQVGATAPPETPIASGGPIALLGGGYALMGHEFNSGVWTFQRYGTDGQPTGPLATLTGTPSQYWSFAPLTGGGYAAILLPSVGSYTGADGFPHGLNQLSVQVFTATGAPVGSPQVIAVTDPGAVSRPAAVPQLAPLTDGGFAVVWAFENPSGNPTVDPSVYARRFNADGTPNGPVQQVSPEGSGFLGVTGLASGGYLVTWGSVANAQGGVRAYGPDGLPLGPAHAAGSNWATGAGPRGDWQPLAGGGAVMAWSVQGQLLQVQQFAPDGTPLPARSVNDATGSLNFAFPSVAGLAGGGYVVAWTELGGSDVYARRYAADGTPLSPQTRVNLVTTGAQGGFVIALPDGGFMIVWSGVGADGVRRNYARRFPSNGLLA